MAKPQAIRWTGTWAWSPVTGEVFWSAASSRILGLDPSETRPSLETLFAAICPDERAFTEAAFRRAARERRDFDQECSIVRPDGATRHIHCLASPAFTKSGTVREYVGAITDFTERWAVEEVVRRTQAELARASRVLTIGTLSASIAHEVNQPLAAVITNGSAALRWLKGTKPRTDKARKALAAIVRDGMRASDIIGHIRVLAKRGAQSDRKPLDVNSLVREVVALLRAEVRAGGATVRLRLADDLPAIIGDAVQLQQVLLNLIMNGLEATSTVADRSKELVISTRRVGDDARVTVRDSGVGFEAAAVERFFEPFYTTKPQGMGIGLTLSRAIVAEHGGRLWAVPSHKYGAIFHLTLPVCKSD